MKQVLISKILIIVTAILVCAGCNGNQYSDAKTLQTELQNLNLINKPKVDVFKVMQNAKYLCKDDWCHKEIEGLPCMQVIHISFQIDDSALVKGYQILNVKNDQLPTACL